MDRRWPTAVPCRLHATVACYEQGRCRAQPVAPGTMHGMFHAACHARCTAHVASVHCACRPPHGTRPLHERHPEAWGCYFLQGPRLVSKIRTELVLKNRPRRIGELSKIQRNGPEGVQIINSPQEIGAFHRLRACIARCTACIHAARCAAACVLQRCHGAV